MFTILTLLTRFHQCHVHMYPSASTISALHRESEESKKLNKRHKAF